MKTSGRCGTYCMVVSIVVLASLGGCLEEDNIDLKATNKTDDPVTLTMAVFAADGTEVLNVTQRLEAHTVTTMVDDAPFERGTYTVRAWTETLEFEHEGIEVGPSAYSISLEVWDDRMTVGVGHKD